MAEGLGLDPDRGEFLLPTEDAKSTDIVNFGRVESLPFVLKLCGGPAAISVAALTHLLVSASTGGATMWRSSRPLGFVRRQ
jgi:hypothetical protein